MTTRLFQLSAIGSVSGYPQVIVSWTMTMNVDEEIDKLRIEIARLGKVQSDGSISVKFGTLFKDDRCANLFEALVGTLRAAKKRKLLKFDGELLLQGVHDNVDIILLPPVKDTNGFKDVPSQVPASKHAAKN